VEIRSSKQSERGIWRWRWALSFLSGATVGFSYPPSILGPLAWIAFVPILALLDEAVRRRQRWGAMLYLFGWAWHGAANWWVMSWQSETDPYLMVAGAVLWIVHPLFLIPALALYPLVRLRNMPRPSALAVVVGAFVTVEWLHSLGDLSYPWLALGYTQLRSIALAQIADVTGVWGVSLVVIALNAVIYDWVARAVNNHQWLAEPGRAALRLGGRMLAVLAVPLVYGVARLVDYSPLPSKPVRIALVQANINPWRKWEYADMEPLLARHLAVQDSLRQFERFDLAIWSETAMPISLLDATGARINARIRSWCDSTDAAVLLGFADIEGYQPIKAYNAAILITPRAEHFPVHRKSRLTPFGEYMPFSDAFPELARMLQWGVGISSWAKGPGATVLPLVRTDTLARLGVMICIESIYPNYVADYVRRGANVLVVITNDAWYDGTPGPDQHFAIAQMRAIETRRPIARCANSGITGFISPTGQVVLRAPALQATCIAAPVHPQHELTLFVRAGDWVPVVCFILSLGMLGWWGIAARRSQRHAVTSTD
jgi:apolipoprotein N-acyltransferase